MVPEWLERRWQQLGRGKEIEIWETPNGIIQVTEKDGNWVTILEEWRRGTSFSFKEGHAS